MNLVLAWPVRLIVIAILVFSLAVDGAGYIYRFVNHYPLTDGKKVPMPPNLFGMQLFIHKGLDLAGGTHMELQLVNIPSGRKPSDIQAVAVDVIRKRVNALGTSEPVVQPEGSDRIIVELAGVNAARAQQVIGRTAKLIFTTWVKDPKAPAGDGTSPGYKPKLSALSGDMVTSASASTDQNTGQWVVNINFNSEGQNLFGKMTNDAVNACPGSGNDCPERHVAAFLDLTQQDVDNWDAQAQQLSLPPEQGGKMLSNPTILEPIPGGQAQISGSFTADTAKALATDLSSGALPASITVLQSTEVGATLGQQSVRQSLLAGLLGLLVVIVFMLAYYRVPGLLASLALVGYAAMVLALYKVLPVVLTLAGMAGFILSVGMAVDANVLIFERFKEELRAGWTIGRSVDAAVGRAWPAIRDSNSSTLITCFVLFFAAPPGSPVQGFAITLGLGVIVSLISAIVVTHNLLAIALSFGGFRRAPMLGVERVEGARAA